LEEIETDEAVDCQVIEQLRDEVLPHAHTIPKEFILKVVVLLNKGSIHSATHTSSTGWFCNILLLVRMRHWGCHSPVFDWRSPDLGLF
jgi:hypothetical protein